MKTYTAHCSDGFYNRDCRVTVDRELRYMPYAQAGIIDIPGGVQLVSYETIVCEIVDGWLHCYGTFSATTRRHIGAFLREVAPSLSYHSAKLCHRDGIEINVETGEVRRAAAGMIRTIGTRCAA